jgi:hypothetical protein
MILIRGLGSQEERTFKTMAWPKQLYVHKLTFSVLTIAKEPVPIRCPVAGMFRFQQSGDIKFQTRILGGVTDSPRPEIHCMDSVSSLQVCDSGQKEMVIDAEFCLSTDTYGRPMDIYST